MAFQIDIYKPITDIVQFSVSAYCQKREQIKTRRRLENIASLGPAINSDNWTFRFVEESGQSLDLIQDNQFATDNEYASNILSFSKSMCLPKEDGSPSLIRANDVCTSGTEHLDSLNNDLNKYAKRIFQKLSLGKKDLRQIRDQFQYFENGHHRRSPYIPRFQSLSDIRSRHPGLHPKQYNRMRWDFKGFAKLGTITNWLGNRISLTDDDLNRLFRKLGTRMSKSRNMGNLSMEGKQFVFELMLIVLHGFDTVKYMCTTLESYEVIDLKQVRYVFHDNGDLPNEMNNLKEEVNHFSYTVLLPLFFTKQLYLHRSRMLAKLRCRLVDFREERKRFLTGNVRRDAINIRMTNIGYAEKAMKLANIVCISDLLDENEENMSFTYGEFPSLRREDICGMPKELVLIPRCDKVHYQVDHILENFGNRRRRTKLDKSLKPHCNSVIRARRDMMVVDGLARQAVVYIVDPAWERDIVGNVDQPICSIFHSNRHKLLAYLTLIELFCICSEEKADTQNYYLKQSYSKDSELLNEEVMEFVETKVADRTSKGDEIKLSDIRAAAFRTTDNRIDAAVIVREIIHYLVTSKAKLVPVVNLSQTDGCYFNILYGRKKFGDGRLLVDGTISLAGLSTTEGDCCQLYTVDRRVLKTDVDLRTRSPEVVHLREGGDQERWSSFPVMVASDLSVG